MGSGFGAPLFNGPFDYFFYSFNWFQIVRDIVNFIRIDGIETCYIFVLLYNMTTLTFDRYKWLSEVRMQRKKIKCLLHP